MKKVFKIKLTLFIVVILNLLLISLSCILPNEFFKRHSYYFYGIQLLILLPFLIYNIIYLKDIFLPTCFTLFYYLINEFLGSILVPRGYGIDKQFTPDILAVNSYNVIVPYFLLINLALFLLSYYALNKLNTKYGAIFPKQIESKFIPKNYVDFMRSTVLFIIFVIISYFKIYMAFAFQLALLIIIFSSNSSRQKLYRYVTFFISLFLMVLLNYDNKREIIIVFFLIVFFEAYHNRWILRFTLKRLFLYTGVAIVFLTLILASSILRGYGQFQVKSIPEAVSHIPDYIQSDIFIDGITDNLELNFCYGTAVSSMDQIINGELKFQYGLTLLKVLFLPLPRKYIPWKPESMMQIYTKNRDPEYFKNGGSYPVIFQCDMFLNFGFLGLIPFILIWFILNDIFIKFHKISKRNVRYFSYPFLFITILIFARGSGLELYIVYYLFGLSLIVLYILLRNFIEHMYRTQ